MHTKTKPYDLLLKMYFCIQNSLDNIFFKCEEEDHHECFTAS